ncbi:hypothetical protein [Mesorhizobium shangrilense]|uniref:Outer membrane protein beta-barrel domain-containing protein n=1 Tax=Mesorhizobium shangrilense TaxID=460060 RepID=A0ABV2D702_9HYPH
MPHDKTQCWSWIPNQKPIFELGGLMYRFSMVVAALIATTSAYAADAVQPLAEESVVTPHISGYGQLYLGGLSYPNGGDRRSAGGGAARVNIPFAGRWNLQGDLAYDRIWNDNVRVDGVGGAVHGYYRDPDSFAAGAFAAYKSYGFGGLSGTSVNDYQVGPEAQVYFGNLTVYGQAYYGQFNFGSLRVDQWGARGVARYFVRKNIRLDAELSFIRTDVGVNLDTLGAAVQAMYRFDDTPWSLFGRYQFEETKIPSFKANDTQKFLIGLRASFGSKSLFDEDRNGATMDTYRPNEVLTFVD